MVIERFCKDCVRRFERHEDIEIEPFDPRTLIATRPFLTLDRLAGKNKRGSVLYPEIILADGAVYVIDGHHKVMRAVITGDQAIDCRVKKCNNFLTLDRLSKRNNGLVWKLPIIQTSKPSV